MLLVYVEYGNIGWEGVISVAITYCGSKDCDYTKTVIMGEEPKKFCGKCGSLMITECSSCGAFRESANTKCCEDCGKPYK